ncbi:MAG: AEC family transporter [Coriobacteriales bacterium]|jgi:predicted permease
MLSLILAQKILSLFIIMGMGFALVRSGVMKPELSRGLALANLYIISPCMLISAFQIDMTDEVKMGFLVALLAGAVVQAGFMLVTRVLARPLRLTEVERASVIYSNAGNLIIPLVSWILGDNMVVYCTAYMVFQTITMFSHGKSLMRGSHSVDLRQIFLNVNMVAMYVGALLFFTGIRFPTPVQDAISSVGSMIGPASMLVTGMIMGGTRFSDFKRFKRLPLVVVLRLVALPLCALAFLKLTPLHALVPNGDMVLLITLLAASSPSASTINQFAQIYGRDSAYASAINVVTILCCIVTMPIMVAIYQL